MANEIKLEVYTFQVRKKGNRSNFLNLDDILGSDILSFFEEYLNSFSGNVSINEQRKKSINFLSEYLVIKSKDRTISGLLESGDYGLEGTIIDPKTGKVKYNKTKDDLDVKPFYFHVWLPEGDDKGIIVLQRLGVFGINGIFTHHFSEYFKTKFEDLAVDFNPLVSKGMAEKFIENGGVKEITLRRFNLPSNIEDKIGLSNYHDVARIEVKIIAKTGRYLPYTDRVKKFLSDKNAALFDVPELRNLGFDGAHSSSVKIKSGNNVRTIDLSDTGQIRPYYDISDEVKLLDSNHPEFTSIDKIAKKLVSELQDEFYGKQ